MDNPVADHCTECCFLMLVICINNSRVTLKCFIAYIGRIPEKETRSMANVAVPMTGTVTPFVEMSKERPSAKTTLQTVHHFKRSSKKTTPAQNGVSGLAHIVPQVCSKLKH